MLWVSVGFFWWGFGLVVCDVLGVDGVVVEGTIGEGLRESSFDGEYEQELV